ncbi:T-lymphocyte activation antigen CD80-like [Thunnus albacares]|uniref:T-lymphocyte activation antigen CD80-like n=1 Tax=Thunnus albacares TaxID=8236 RepID=UPI001CF68DF9|nr:T-lymphocyte activation antigen CD80-like [Thunnus albacares]
MDLSSFPRLKSEISLDYFCVLRAQTCPQRAMPVSLWRTGLLLSFLTLCASVEEECVLGIVGRPVSLPCFYPELITFVNISIEWRRDSEVVLRSVWAEDGNVEICSKNSVTISADAPMTGNLSLKLPNVDVKEDKTYYSLFLISPGNQSAPLCTVCLRTAASYSSPLLLREEAAQGDETFFLCQSSGGFPEPAVYWLINDTQEPPEGSVRTLAASLPDSRLYNITSHLTANISKDSSVSCIIENPSMKETLSSTSYGEQGGPVVSRASQAMWMFSTALCVVVGVMVAAGVAYQIHLDRMSKKKKEQYQHSRPGRGYRRRNLYMEETEAMKSEPKETDV